MMGWLMMSIPKTDIGYVRNMSRQVKQTQAVTRGLRRGAKIAMSPTTSQSTGRSSASGRLDRAWRTVGQTLVASAEQTKRSQG